MKYLSVICYSFFVLLSCNKEENACRDDQNARIDGGCYWGFINDYDIEGEWSNEGQLVRTLSEKIVIEFRGEGPTFDLYINGGNRYYNKDTKEWVEEYGILEKGETYTSAANSGTGMTENDFGGGSLTVTLTKVDREEKRISGNFEWKLARQNSSLEWVEDIIKGTFTDVVANLNSE